MIAYYFVRHALCTGNESRRKGVNERGESELNREIDESGSGSLTIPLLSPLAIL